MEEKKLFSLGIEEEFQIVDPESRELRSHIQEILEDGKLILAEHVKPKCINPLWKWELMFAMTLMMLGAK